MFEIMVELQREKRFFNKRIGQAEMQIKTLCCPSLSVLSVTVQYLQLLRLICLNSYKQTEEVYELLYPKPNKP